MTYQIWSKSHLPFSITCLCSCLSNSGTGFKLGNYLIAWKQGFLSFTNIWMLELFLGIPHTHTLYQEWCLHLFGVERQQSWVRWVQKESRQMAEWKWWKCIFSNFTFIFKESLVGICSVQLAYSLKYCPPLKIMPGRLHRCHVWNVARYDWYFYQMIMARWVSLLWLLLYTRLCVFDSSACYLA